MSAFWNSRTSSLSPYLPGEQPKAGEFIKLNTNENPYPPSPKAVEAMQKVLNDDEGRAGEAGRLLRLYPDPVCQQFREAVAEAYKVKPAQVFPANGSDEALAFAFGAFFESAPSENAGAETVLPVLFPDITYSFYPVYAKLWGIPFKEIPLTQYYAVHVDDYLEDSGGAVLPNPNAPTGRALPFAEVLEAVAAFHRERGKVVVIDEAYAAFGAESAVPFIEKYPNLLTVHTLSKSGSLAGLRAGFAIGSAELIEGLFRVRDSFNSYTMDRLALAGAAAAVADAAYYEKINGKVAATRDRVSKELAKIGFTVLPSKANFLFIKPPANNDGTPKIGGKAAFEALRKRKILVRHFDKPRTADWLRVSIGSDADMDAFLAACGELATECRR